MECTDALGFQAAAALEAYEELLPGVCRPDADPGRTGLLQLALRRVCTCCLGSAQLSGAALGLLLAHHALLSELTRSGGDLSDAAAAQALRRVEECVHVLKRACRELFLAPHLH